MTFKRGRRYTFYGPSLCWPPMRWWHVIRHPLWYLWVAAQVVKARLRKPAENEGYFTITAVENQGDESGITIEEKKP